jgi:hypothetical protein
VKPAASIDLQTGGRAAHVTAKAILDTGAPKPVVGSGGVFGAARVTGEVRNTRHPSAPSESGRTLARGNLLDGGRVMLGLTSQR